MGTAADGHIWDGRHHELCTKPRLTAEDVNRWETKYRLRLPASLVAALKVQNGGSLKPNRFKFGSEIHILEDITGVAVDEDYGCLAPISQFHHGEGEGVYPDKQGDPDKLVILSGDGHSYYCLDYNGTPPDRPAVCSVELECEPGNHRICDSFDELLAHAYAGDPEPSFRFGELPAGFKVAASLESNSRHKGKDMPLIKTRALVGLADQEVLVDQEDYCWSGDLRHQRVRCPLATLAVEDIVELDLNGKRVPPVFELVLKASGSTLGMTCTQEGGLWINEDSADFRMPLADNDRGKLKKLRVQLLASQKK